MASRICPSIGYNPTVMASRTVQAKPEIDVFVDSKSGRKSVTLSLTAYKRLLRKIEDLEDALALDEARRTATEFVDYADFRKELKLAGKL